MPDDMLHNPNTIPAKADFAVHSDGSLDLANFVGEILPSTDPVLVSLGGSLKEYQKLRRDDQVAALMQQRQDKLVEAEWEVVSGGEDRRDIEAADWLRQCLNGLQFDQTCRKMHGTILYGYGVAECLWARDGARVILADIRVRAPWRFGFGKDGLLKLKVQTEYRPMPPRKFWLTAWGAEDDDSPYGTGLGHMLWWPVFLKRNGARFWAAYPPMLGDAKDQRSWTMWCTLWLSECWRIAREGAPLMVFTDWRQLPALTDAVQGAGWSWRGIVAWDKRSARPQLGRFRQQCEYVIFASRGRFAAPSRACLPGVYAYPVNPASKVHLTSKPVALITDLLAVTAADATVLDPFMGGGSVGEACLATGRGYIGCELSPEYFEISRERLKKFLTERG